MSYNIEDINMRRSERLLNNKLNNDDIKKELDNMKYIDIYKLKESNEFLNNKLLYTEKKYNRLMNLHSNKKMQNIKLYNELKKLDENNMKTIILILIIMVLFIILILL
jgi:hypothetical protein